MDGDGFSLQDEASMVGRRRNDSPIFAVIEIDHPRRSEAEAFIAERYSEAYAADVTDFMPVLFALLGPNQNIMATAGLRRGDQGTLFVEHYLDAPAEFVLAERFGAAVDRRRVAEIGHLSGVGHGSGRRLFPLIARWLQAEGIDWALFAATGSLRSLFERLSIKPLPLAPARRERLGESAAAWGRYYDSDPWVVGGPLQLGRRLLDLAP
jgi:hypothetical protein